jgi:hypothetical protein
MIGRSLMMSTSSTTLGAQVLRLALAGSLAVASGAVPAAAQIAPQGTPTVLNTVYVRGVDAAFDPNTNTYMVVGAADNVFAVCTNAAGAAVSPVITIKPAQSMPYGSFPRVKYSRDLNGGAGAFLVIWEQEELVGPPQLYTRIVSCTAGLLGPEQVISAGYAPWNDFGASALDYSATSRQFLVAWKTAIDPHMVVRLVDLNGAGVGPVVTISREFARDPSVAWNPSLNEFGVSFSGESAAGGYSAFARMPAGNIAAFTRTEFNFLPGGMTAITELAFNPVTQRYIMAWYQLTGYVTKVAEFDGAGNLLTTGLVSSTLGSYDALGMSYNPISGTFALVSVYRDPANNDPAMVTELNSRGYKFSGDVRIDSPPVLTPIRHPRIVSHTGEKTWLSVLNGKLIQAASQIVVTATSNGGPAGSYPPADGGTCTYALSPTGATVGAGGGSGSFTVTTSSSCAWTAATANSWIHITAGASGTGTGTVSYSVDATTGPPRTGTITAGGQTFVVSQNGNCSWVLNPTSSGAIPAGGGTGSFTVTTTAGCSWTATPSASWIRLTSAGSGTSSGTVSYSVDANSGSARTGAITVANQSFAVTQNALVLPPGCTTTVTVLSNPTPPPGVGGVDGLWQSSGVYLTAGQAVTLVAYGNWSDAGVTLTPAGHPTVTVTGADCPLSGAPLLALIGRIGPTGAPFLIGASKTFTPAVSGLLYLAPQDNWYYTWDNAGSISVAVCPASGACSYTLTPASSGTFAAAGGSGSFTVTTTTGCAWTATTVSSWIHVTSGSGPGSGTVTYTVDPNPGSTRTGTITVADKTYTVTQAASGTATCTSATVVAATSGAGGVEPMWQPTGITLTAGQPVAITASGTWSDAGVSLTAAGHPTATVTGDNCPLPGAPLLALVGRIGPTGAPFLIGASASFTPATSGVLYLAPQDNWYETWNNAGSLSVSVCVGSGTSCSYALTPTSSGTLPAAGGGGSFTVTTGTGCAWTATTAASWIHVTSGSGTSSGTVTYTVDVNPGSARTGTITVADKTYTVTQAASTATSCTSATVVAATPGTGGVEAMWQPTGITVTAGRPLTITATGTWSNAGVSVTAAGHPTTTITGVDCPLSGAPLLALVGRIGPTGTPFLIGASKSFTPATSGVLYLAPQDNWYYTWDNAGSLSVSVCQDASGCTYTIDPSSSGTVAASGGSGSFSVATGSSCTWTATTASSWIHVTSGSGPGSGTVTYTVDVNPGSARTGTITVADKTYTVTQAASTATSCTSATVVAATPGTGGVEPMWQPTGITLTAGQPVAITASGTWSNAGVSLTAAGHPTVTVTGDNCPLSGAPLLALVGRIGPTGAPFLIGTSASFTPATSGVLYLAPQDNWYETWNNAGSLSVSVCVGSGTSCSYALTPTSSGTIPAAGGGGSFTVTTGTGCAWTATTPNSWIHITSGSGPSSGTVTYVVDVNSGTARTGTITVGDKTYTVTQAASAATTCTPAAVMAATPGTGGVESMWQPTGVTLTAGQPVVITASGTWSDAGVSLTAAGHPTVTVTGADCPLSGAPLLALVGRIGPTGVPFLIGASKSFTPTTSGVLYLAPQDNWYYTWDNAGSLSVGICK